MDDKTIREILILVYPVAAFLTVVGTILLSAQFLGKYKSSKRIEHRVRK